MNTTYQTGQTLYWSRVPAGRFTYRHENRDGSLALFGGEPGYGAYRDARPEDISTVPFTGIEQVLHFASLDENLFAHVSIGDLAERFGLTESAVRRVVTERPDIFRRIARGLYEVRNPEADRQADKG